MILKDNLVGDLEVKFTNADWNCGTARQAIALMKKEFPAVYISATKKWLIRSNKAQECRKALRELEERNSKMYEQYDIEEFMQQFEDKVNESEESETNEEIM